MARGAHRYYATLARTYDACSHSAKVNRITKRQLNRAGMLWRPNLDPLVIDVEIEPSRAPNDTEGVVPPSDV